MGYVGLPLTLAAHRAGFSVIGFDIDPAKVDGLNAGRSHLSSVPQPRVAAMVEAGRFTATGDYGRIADADTILICVPTPLSRHREPDLSFIRATAAAIAPRLRRGQLVVLESTTYPGTTRDVLKPILETSGFKVGQDVFLAYSPEREDPGNIDFETATIPRVVGADDELAAGLVARLYATIVSRVVPVADTATAEAVKLTENIFRSVNIALVNELKLIYERMGIDIWEVLAAAKTKPFGYMPFYPGPGLGGHCVPIDPFYLTWKAREFGVPTRFIELAGEINTAAPLHVVDRLIDALSGRRRQSIAGARILLVGMAYKKNVDDTRESPALVLMEELERRGATVAFYDPFVPVIPPTREHPLLAGRRAIAWSADELERFDAALIATDHDGVDYAELTARVPLVVDTRNATAAVTAGRERIVRA
nr:nucleotide sugar dehydrogenase [Chelatococcus reniformis]